MNITNFELMSAAIEFSMGFIFILLSITVRLKSSGNKSLNIFMHLFSFAACIFIFEALAYVYRGNVNSFSLAMTRVSNFLCFFFNLLLANAFIQYVLQHYGDDCRFNKKVYRNIVICLTGIAFVILVLNLFLGCMYYFDENNYYHRNYMWYVYTILLICSILVSAWVAIRNHRAVSKAQLTAILIFTFMPLTAIVIQFFYYGVSVSSIGVGLALVVMLLIYLRDWFHSEKIDEDELQNHNWLRMAIFFLIMVTSMSASVVSCVISIGRISHENSEGDSKIVAHMVSSAIENEFIKPITVAQTMCQDSNLIKSFSECDSENPTEIEDAMSEFLQSIKEGFGYQMTYAASERTKAYYTDNGICKMIDTENDPHDLWYKELKDASIPYVLNMDTDEANNWELSVFVNNVVYGKNHEFLGISGIGIELPHLQSMIKEYENEYNIKINLVKPDGVVQIDADSSNIETVTLDNSYFDKVNDGEFYYEFFDTYSRLTTYISDLDWYVVIIDYNPNKISVSSITTPSIIIFIIGIIIMGVSFVVLNVREQKISKALIEKNKVSITDGLTGLYNRRGYENYCEMIEKSGVPNNLALIMIDLNGLKTVNDNLGHNAGDELIIGASNCMHNAFSSYGNVYRVGGDEFIIVLTCSAKQVAESIDTVEHLFENWKGEYVTSISASKGVVRASEHPEWTIAEIKQEADRLMYEDKNEYYRKSGLDRRAH